MTEPNAIDWHPPRWLKVPPGEWLANPDIAGLLAHLGAELKRTRRHMDPHEARHFEGALAAAADAVQAGDPAALALRFFLLGMATRELGAPIRGARQIELMRAGVDEKRRRLPLERRNARAQAGREAVQELARGLWAQPEHRALRLGEMCELVWSRVIDAGAPPPDCLPDGAQGLKPWLRPVAPAAARKAGAPRK